MIAVQFGKLVSKWERTLITLYKTWVILEITKYFL